MAGCSIGHAAAGAGNAAEGVAQQYTNQARGFGQDVSQRTGAAGDAALKTATDTATAANAADEQTRKNAETARQAAAQNNLSQQAIQSLGLNAGDRTYGVNLGQYVNYQGRDMLGSAKPEEVMSQADFQKFGNLKKLMGQDTTGYDASKVGTYQAGKIGYDKEAAAKAIAENKAVVDQCICRQGNFGLPC